VNYSRTLLRAVGLGIFSGVFGVVYLGLMLLGAEAIWGHWEAAEYFTGSWQIVAVPIIAGAIVGLLYRTLRLPPRIKGFIEELEEGHVDTRTAPGALAVALVSLVGGASLGPEAPLGTAGGAAGTWLAERRGEGQEGIRQSSYIGMSAAFGGLLATPISGTLLAFELEHEQSHGYYFQHLIPGLISGAVAFGVMWPIIGAPFIGLLAIDAVEFRSWMLLAAAGIGVFAFLTSLVIGKTTTSIVNAMRRLDGRPVTRGVVGGVVVAVTAFILPLTLFSGDHALTWILEHPGSVGVLTLVVLAILKAIALGASLGGGFYGGPFFPLFFMGGVLGIAINMVFPDIPLIVSVGSMMAALGAAASLLPLSIAVLVSLMLGAGIEVSSAIVVAAAIGFALRYALIEPGAPSDTAAAAAPTPEVGRNP
jgi:H+/Cl- antiporter ClcA